MELARSLDIVSSSKAYFGHNFPRLWVIVSFSKLIFTSLQRDMAATDVPEPMAKLFAQIDKNKKHYIDNLAKAVAIKSVSAWPETRAEITTMMTWMGEELKGLGASIEYVDIGSQTLPDGQVGI